jgi:predicted nucleotidyltransferase
VIAIVGIPLELAGYLDDLVAAMESAAELDAVYLIGSAALGAYEHGRSDVDVIAVTSRSLSIDERQRLADAAGAVPCPASKLELVTYPRESDVWEINLNTGEPLSFDTAEVPGFWFVIDRAIAEQHAVPLLGPPWTELFEPVPRDVLLDALEQSLGTIGTLNMTRCWVWLETGEWVSKPHAETWLRERVLGEIEARR